MTYPIEKAVSAVSDVKFVESKSRQGLSTVRLWMNWGADVNNGQVEVMQRIQQILNSLPTGIKQPFIIRADLSNIPVEDPKAFDLLSRGDVTGVFQVEGQGMRKVRSSPAKGPAN